MAKIIGREYACLTMFQSTTILSALLQRRKITIDGTKIQLSTETWCGDGPLNTIWECNDETHALIRPIPNLTFAGFLNWIERAKEIKIEV